MLSIVGERSGPYYKLAVSMDKIGWRRFMEGMISKEVVAIQSTAVVEDESKVSLEKWGQLLV